MSQETQDNNLLDNYLTPEEKAYFENGDTQEGESKYESSIADEAAEADQERGTTDSGAEPESSDESNESDRESNDEREESNDGEDESDYDSEPDSGDPKTSKRDYEKAFKVERHKRKELKEALEANAKRTAEMEAVVAQLQKAMQTPPVAPVQEKQEPIPDPDVDPLGHQQYQIKQLERTIIEHNQYLKQRHEHEQRASQQQAFIDTYKQSAEQFSQKAPDFKDAYKFLTAARMAEHQAAGYSPDEANRLLVEEEMSIVSKAYNDKVNPAERIYSLAKNRGYSAGSTPKKGVPAKNINDLKKGMANAKSLGSGGGEMGEKTLGMEDIDSMNFNQFDEFWSSFKAKSKGM